MRLPSSSTKKRCLESNKTYNKVMLCFSCFLFIFCSGFEVSQTTDIIGTKYIKGNKIQKTDEKKQKKIGRISSYFLLELCVNTKTRLGLLCDKIREINWLNFCVKGKWKSLFFIPFSLVCFCVCVCVFNTDRKKSNFFISFTEL